MYYEYYFPDFESLKYGTTIAMQSALNQSIRYRRLGFVGVVQSLSHMDTSLCKYWNKSLSPIRLSSLKQ
eukprot:5028514-Amphidinium_carterae.2